MSEEVRTFDQLELPLQSSLKKLEAEGWIKIEKLNPILTEKGSALCAIFAYKIEQIQRANLFKSLNIISDEVLKKKEVSV